MRARARLIDTWPREAVSLAVCPSGALSYFRCLYVYVMEHLLNVSGDLSQTEFLNRLSNRVLSDS